MSTVSLPSFESRAKSLFISQYVLESDKTNLFAYMRFLHQPKAEDPPLLATVIRAVFLAFFSFSHHSQSALYHARVSYGSALSLTSSAIQSSKEARKDATLLALLLMSVFERLTHTVEGQIPIRSGHLRGALGLVRYRGNALFSGWIGTTMFLQLTELVTLECLASGVEIPSDLLALRARAAEKVDSQSPKWKFSEILLQYANLKFAIENGHSQAETIPRAEILDYQLDLLSQQLQPFVLGKKGNLSRRTTSDKYPDHSTRRSWNNIRVLRILLAEAIREQCTQFLAFANTTEQASIIGKLHDTTQRIISLSTDICLSIPKDKFRGTITGNFSSVQSSTLFFHLFVSKSSSTLPSNLHTTICDKLGELARGQFRGLERIMTEILHGDTISGSDIWKVWLKIGQENFSIDV
jgi:hypothetical protein